MKFAFQIDPIETLNIATDTSWQLMLEASKHGKIYYYTPANLLWLKGEVLAIAQEMIPSPSSPTEAPKALEIGDPLKVEKINLTEMDIIFIRQDPPYDMNYLTTTYLLEKIEDQVLIVNSPRAIRNFPEKISILDYMDLIPPTLITSNFHEAQSFASNYQKIIIKPLYSFAGQDVFCTNYQNENFFDLFNNVLNSHHTPVIVQKFIDRVTYGDKRIILVNGEIIGGYNRIPNSGEIRANAACGGTISATELTQRDLEICDRIKSKLIDNDLFLVGIDIIDGYLTEINITSPTGVPAIQKLYQKNITKEIFDKLINKLNNFKKIKDFY